MKWLVFSKDRPYQLDAFIRTAISNAEILPKDISVLYRYTEDFQADVDTLTKEHPDVQFIRQTNFREDVIHWISSGDSTIVSFATDDAVFTRKVPIDTIERVLLQNEQVITFSLRMGLHLEDCYPTNSKQQLPNGMLQDGIFAWNTAESEGDWSYPLSVDGHVFKRDLAAKMFASFDFAHPNSMESNWQAIRHLVSPIACCLPKSCYFNIPLNRVQDTHKNRCGSVDVAELQSNYRSGTRIDTRRFLNFINTSAHQEVEI